MSSLPATTRAPARIADICRRYRVRRLQMFGSTAVGQQRPDSDVDLLVEFLPGQAPSGFALVDLPLVPQHDEGKSKNNPQNGAAHIVHGAVLSWKKRVKSRGPVHCSGTGSSPPAHQGWQRPKRCAVK